MEEESKAHETHPEVSSLTPFGEEIMTRDNVIGLISMSSPNPKCEFKEHLDSNVHLDEANVVDFGNHFTTKMTFSTKEELISWARSIGKGLGFVITIQSADKLTSRARPRVTLGCDRAGFKRCSQSANNPNKKIRKSSSKRCGCPFLLKGIRDIVGTEWSVQVKCGTHNHGMVHLEAHSYAGRLNEFEQEIVHEMYAANVKPRKILTAIKRRDESNTTVLRTIYNERVKLRKKELEGGTAIQFLYKCITDFGYCSFNKVNTGSNRLESLFFAHPTSVRLCSMFPTVFVMDCTYKTNRFRLPLLSIVGVTSTNMSFYAAFVFISNEIEDSYVWALEGFKSILDVNALPQVLVTDREMALMNAIKIVFPHSKNILCKVHISRNILAHCKKFFEKGKDWEVFILAWHRMTESRSESDFTLALQSLEKAYAVKYPELYSYFTTTWVIPYKEYFVSTWVDRFLHLGTTTTNRVESGHSHLKKFLEVSVGNLTTVWKTFDHMINLQHTEIKRSFGQSIIQVNKEFRTMLYSELLGRVSTAALEIIQKEFNKMKSGHNVECTHTCRQTLGLPCSHELVPYATQTSAYPLWMVHNHWKQLKLDESFREEEVKVEPTSDNELDIEMMGIVRRYKSTNVLQKHEIKRKLREIMDPTLTQTIEPVAPSKLKGRPKGSSKYFEKEHKSTKRNLSLFEHVLLDEKRENVLKVSCASSKTSSGQKRLLQMVQKQMPTYMSKFITNVVNVAGDGHCGYRVISLAMDMGDDWKRVRSALQSELLYYDSLYTEIYGAARKSSLLASLDCTVVPAPLDNWMTMPDMGLIVASYFNIKVVHFSKFQSFTFLPLHSAPPPMPRTIFIGFINDNHFVQLLVHDDCPLPPIFSSWTRYHQENARQWDLQGLA